jgi:hypothetical protein
MNTPTHPAVAVGEDQGEGRSCNLNPDAVPEGASFSGPVQSPNTVRPYVLEGGASETFIGGAGI